MIRHKSAKHKLGTMRAVARRVFGWPAIG